MGYTEWLEINQSGAYGDVTGMENVGGLVGFAGEDTHIIASHAKGDIHTEDVEGGARYLGGLIGHGDYAVIKNSYATGSVEGYNGVGGLAGYTYSSLIERSYATGAVSDISGSWGYSIGGLAGEIEGTDVHSAYSAGLVSGTSNDDIGGFIGRIKWSGNSVINGGWWTGSHGTAIGQDDSGAADPYFEVSSPDDFKNVNHEIYTTSSEAHGYWQFEDDDYNGPAVWEMSSSVNTGFPCHVWEPGCGEEPESESSAGDNDGVAAEIEHAAPNGGDGNADGTPDREQNNVASLVSPVSGKYVTVEAAGAGCALASVSITSESSHAAQDAGYDYQTGFVNFTATCGQTNVKIYYHGVAPGSLTVRKYNPTANSYFTIEAATIAAAPAPLSGTLVSYTIVDNDGLLDINPADGVITDPVALGGLVINSPNTGLKRTTPQP